MASLPDIRALVRVAKLKNSENPKQFLEDLLLGIFDAGDFSSGKILVSSTEAGGTVTFSVPPGHTPTSLLRLVEEAIEWLGQQPDPVNPNLAPRRIVRLRASFNKAVI